MSVKQKNNASVVTNMVMLAALLFVSCTSPNDDEDGATIPQRTVLIYMAADNNLYKNAQTDIDEMLSYAMPVDGTLLVYVDVPEWSSANGGIRFGIGDKPKGSYCQKQ